MQGLVLFIGGVAMAEHHMLLAREMRHRVVGQGAHGFGDDRSALVALNGILEPVEQTHELFVVVIDALVAHAQGSIPDKRHAAFLQGSPTHSFK